MKISLSVSATVLCLIMGASMAGASDEGGKALRIEVLSIPKCAATPPTIALVKETMEEMGLKGTVENIVIDDAEEANRHRFIGSPTVQINGLDIDPAMRSIERFGVT